jgi:hypothetical protein
MRKAPLRSVRAGLCAGLALALGCSSGPSGQQPDPQSPAEAQPVAQKRSGEFYDLSDVPFSHPQRAAVGLLLWSGVPLEDDQGKLLPESSLTESAFLVWGLTASNRPLTHGLESIGAPGTPLALEPLATATAIAQGLIANEPMGGEKLFDDKSAQILARKLAGQPFESGYPWYTKAKGENLTRAEGVRLLVESLRPEGRAFDPDRGDASLLLPTGKFWSSVWDARLAKATPAPRRAVFEGRHKGATIESLKPPDEGRYGDPSFDGAVKYLQGLGVNSIAVIPYARLLRYDLPSIAFDTAAGYPRASVEAAIRQGKARGARVILKPHLWMANRPENQGQWTGSTKFTPEGWSEWLSRYRSMVLTYAEMAERAGADVLVLGTELKSATYKHPDFFKQLIREMRLLFRGEITYAANHDEFQRIPFWGELDYVGVDAYFALSEAEAPTPEEISSAWEGPKAELAEASAKSGKKVLFLEAGYKPRAFALRAPWEWQAGGEERQEIQAAGYEGMLRSLWGEEWFAGVYIWKYFSNLDSKAAEAKAEQFAPYGKLAEGVLKKYFQP